MNAQATLHNTAADFFRALEIEVEDIVDDHQFLDAMLRQQRFDFIDDLRR